MTVRPDNRLADGPMQTVGCDTCGARVEVRKSSWEQTSIQWHADAVEACLERRAASPRPGPNGATFSGCQALRQAISAAAVRGELGIQDSDPLPVNPEAHDQDEVART
ncbi:ferredoxin [Nocardioides piscis]|uniref:Ferredoxin n=1 Tax=Nocardioides piscis TaxID=2714938 RepID=A0A6G7YH59_9ACTN|nr:ferredoxin [Nocardioides piscis]QIK76155.1 ferredoxin [Nocardioides piscis]